MPSSTPDFSQVGIVLVRPRVAENIGAAARVAHNMGIKRLILVRDEMPEREPMAKLATHNAAHLLDSMQRFTSLGEALSDFSMVVGTTARHGRQRCIPHSPRNVVKEIIAKLPTNPTAIVFGPEDTGLTNEDLALCQLTTSIPTAHFSSLNLAQAVAILCYELYYEFNYCSNDVQASPKMATSFELESMYSRLEHALRTIDFLDDTNRHNQMYSIRRFFSRLTISSKEANIIRGICKKFLEHNKIRR